MMSASRPHSAFEIANGLHWLRGEIDHSLMRARVAIEDHLDDGDESTGTLRTLDVAADELRMVGGSLAMIECFGAAMLAQEMLALLEALIAGEIERKDEAYEVLSGATLQLSDYVDLVAHGAPDRVLVLQPLLNELRLARDQPLATEAELFARQLRLPDSAEKSASEINGNADAAQTLAKRELMAFQTAFLQWFRGQNIDAALDRIGRIGDAIAVNVAAPALRGFWSSCSALAECLRQQSQESLDLKRLFGRAVSQLKLLADGGEAAALAQLGDAPHLMLFHIARAPNPGAHANELIAALQLDVLVPSLAEITDLRRRLRGPNTAILHRLYAEIRSDFTQLKDAIDLAVRTEGRSGGDIGLTRERLRRMAQTVGTLGLPSAQATLMNQSAAVADLPPGAPQWVETAIAILRVEYSLEEALFRALGRGEAGAARDFAEIEHDVPHKQDLRDSTAAFVRECLVEFAQIKTAVDAYRARGEAASIALVSQRLHGLSATMRVVGQTRAAELASDLQRYVDEGGLAVAGATPGGFEPFADALSSAEIFFEALRDELPNPEKILDDVAVYVRRLRGADADAEPLRIHLDFRPVGEKPADAAEDLAANEPASPALVSAPIGEGIDPEIRGIFIDEAGDVLQSLRGLLPQLKRSPADRAKLIDVRRAFHTLKGSGRMAGALRIGEFGWAIENLLNRVLNDAASAPPPVLELLEQAAALLPRLVENFRGGAETEAATDTETTALMDLAARLSEENASTEPNLFAVFRDDARERLQFVRRWLDAHRDGTAGTRVEPEIVRAFHTLRGSSAVVDSQNIHELSAALERYLTMLASHARLLPQPALPLLVDALAAIDAWLDRADTGEADASMTAAWNTRVDALLSTSKATATAKAEVDEAFCIRVLDALQVLETQVDQWSKAPMASAAAELRDGFDALAKLARSNGAESLVASAQAVAEPLANWIDDVEPPAEFFAALMDLLEGLYQQLDAYRSGMPADVSDEWPVLLQALRRPSQAAETVKASTPAIESETEILSEAESAHATPVFLPDFELYAESRQGFEAQAHRSLEVLDQTQSAWAEGDPTVVPELREAFASLERQARAARISEIADIAQQLSRELDQLATDSVAPLQSRVAKGIEDLHRLLGERLRGETVEAVSTPPPSDVLAPEPALPATPPPLDFQLDDPVSETVAGGALETSAEITNPDGPAAIDPAPAAQHAPEAIDLALDSMFDDAGTAEETAIEAAIEPAPAEPEAVPSVAEAIEWSASEPPATMPISLDATSVQTPAPASAETVSTEAAEVSSPNLAAPEVLDEATAERIDRRAPSADDIGAVSATPAKGDARALDHELTDIFAGEAGELLEQLDTGFAAWHKSDDGGALLSVQRALHTLKGGARMSGLEAMGDVAHDLESRVNAVAARGSSLDAATYRSLRESFDQLQRMHDQIRRGDAEQLAAPHAERLFDPPAANAPSLSGWLPELFWRPQEEAGTATAARREAARVPVEVLDGMLNQVGEISINRSRLEERNGSVRTQLAEMSQTVVRLREHLRLMEAETDAQISARGLGPDAVENREADRYAQDFDPLEMDRFSRMQELSRALAESVNDLAALQTAMDDAVRETENLLLLQSRINTEVQQGLMGTLMVPFSRQLQRFQRLVQQTSQENGKQADIRFNGAEAELDRKVLDRITAPLEHLLRNAVVHGIEEPARRAQTHKTPIGTIQVSLNREGSQLLVEVADDGGGLDLPAIRARAVERGLLASHAQVSDGELARFIFEPGFSTAKALTQDAGRGIGMDVVASEVKQLGGTLELRSEAGQGARS